MIAVLVILSGTSCSDYFETVPSETINLDMVFLDRNLAAQWLAGVYAYLPDETNQNYTGGSDETRGIWTPACIEGKLPWDHCNSNLLNNGSYYASTGYVQNMWRAYYRGIQNANIYLANIDRCKDMPVGERIRSKAEARALRSIFYFNLFKIYGPFVIVYDEVFDPEIPTGSVNMVRSSVDECVDYIISEFDILLSSNELATKFVMEETEKGTVASLDDNFAGNITREVVEAIRSQVLLYSASDLFNGNSYYKNLEDHTGKKIFPQEKDPMKWVRARKAAKDFMDNNPYFSLVYRTANGTHATSIASSCPFISVRDASLGTMNNEEMIFVRTSGDWNIRYTMTPKHVGIPGIPDAQSGAGALSVPLQMVDLFFTDKGIRIEDDPDYYNYTNDEEEKFTSRNMTSTDPCRDKFGTYTYFYPGTGRRIMKQFYNREPRFYVAFTFQNLQWSFDASKTYYTDFSLNGNSGRAKNGHDFPKSGVLARKPLAPPDRAVYYYVSIRLAEIYLNYAEASNECGDIAEAIKYVNKIRARAGVAEYKGMGDDATPTDNRGQQRIEIPLDYEHVRNVIRRERLIELAYENHHYFDVRRWGVAGMQQGDGWVYPTWHTGGEGGKMMGFNVEVDMAPESTSHPVNTMYFYKKVAWETRIFSQKMNLFPIPQTEINVNPLVVQNTGWGVIN